MKATEEDPAMALVRQWRASGIALREPAANSMLSDFERTYGVRLPDDMRALYLIADGMEEEEADAHGIRLWPLKSVSPIEDELPEMGNHVGRGCFVFADYSMWAHGYALDLSPGMPNRTVIVGGAEPIVVARNFPEFLQTWVSNPRALFG